MIGGGTGGELGGEGGGDLGTGGDGGAGGGRLGGKGGVNGDGGRNGGNNGEGKAGGSGGGHGGDGEAGGANGLGGAEGGCAVKNNNGAGCCSVARKVHDWKKEQTPGDGIEKAAHEAKSPSAAEQTSRQISQPTETSVLVMANGPSSHSIASDETHGRLKEGWGRGKGRGSTTQLLHSPPAAIA